MKSITAKEREIIDLLKNGLSSKEIAIKLNITFHTVESHRRNLRNKFSAKDSYELIQKVTLLRKGQ